MDKTTIILATISVFFIVAVGAFTRYREILTEKGKESILKLLINILMPFFIFSQIAPSKEINQSFENVALPFGFGLGFTIFSFLGVLLFAKYFGNLLGLPTAASKRTFAVATGLQNYGFLAIPIISAIFGKELIGILLVHNVGIELALWTIGILLISGNFKNLSFSKIFNPPCIAIIISLMINYSGIGLNINPILLEPVSLIGASAIPFGLMMVGASVFEHCKKQASALVCKLSLRHMVSACFLRLLVLPALMLYLGTYISSPDLQKVIIIESAMPSALFPIVLADYYKGDSKVAFQVAIATTLVGFFTIVFWVQYGISLYGF